MKHYRIFDGRRYKLVGSTSDKGTLIRHKASLRRGGSSVRTLKEKGIWRIYAR